jgi:hypothetical protein
MAHIKMPDNDNTMTKDSDDEKHHELLDAADDSVCWNDLENILALMVKVHVDDRRAWFS